MMMYVGHNILGYSIPIDNYVSKYSKKGNLTSFNCPEEVLLAEKLIKIILGHTWLNLLDPGEKQTLFQFE